MTIQEKIEWRKSIPYDAMGDYSVFSKNQEEEEKSSMREEKSTDMSKLQKVR